MARGDGLLVGLEIHQQLACSSKLFCACPPVKSEEFPYHFERRLRPAQSETGRLDPAAVFEFAKGKPNVSSGARSRHAWLRLTKSPLTP